MTTTEDPEGWRAAVGRYLGEDPESQADATPLALRFELREFQPRNRHRWNGALTQAIKATPSAGLGRDVRLAVRPVSKTAKGWARGTLTWGNLPHIQARLHLNPQHHRWCSEFGALYRAVAPTSPTRDPEWVFLDDFANPALWTLLDQAAELGVALLAAGPATTVRRGSAAELTLDARQASDGLTLAPRLAIDGVDVQTGKSRPIGRHGIYALDDEGKTIILAPTNAPLTDEQTAMLGPGRPPTVRIPTTAIRDFFADYLPELRGRVVLGSSDGSVEIPEPAPATLILVVTHTPQHVVTLAWRWDDRGGGRRPSLTELGLDGLPSDWLAAGSDLPRPATLRDVDAAEFVTEMLPDLSRLPGLRIETHGQAPDYRELTGAPQMGVTVVPAEKHDWFNLGITITVDGHTIPFTPLFTALAQGRRKLLLIDGSYLSLHNPALRDLSNLIAESLDLDEWEPPPTISKHQMVTIFPAFEDLADESETAANWRSLVAEVDPDAVHDTAAPLALQGTLRPYQLAGFSWLVYLWRHRLGGILGDDMGLGKTLQTLALIQHANDNGTATTPFLIVAPTSVVPNWVTEAARFTPDLTVESITATEAAGRVSIAEVAARADIVVTSYALLRLDFDRYEAVAMTSGWAGLVLDEAQFVKNPTAQVHQCALDLSVAFKLGITGTPMENSLADVQALFAIVAPGLFPSAAKFHRRYIRPIEQPMTGIASGVGAGTAPEVAEQVRADRLAALRHRIRPFLLRRTKQRVAAELPDRQEQVIKVDLAPQHRDLYDLYLQRERRKVLQLLDDEEKNSKFIVFRSLTLLRLLALDAGLVDSEYDRWPSAKLTVLLEQLADVVAEGHRALVFSQFTSYLTKVAARLDDEGIAYAYLDGSTRNRQKVIDGFRNGDAPVFLMSLKAGGFGLNLTEADYVFLLDPWWNPASEQQAIDRTHRIGQTRNVLVYRLVAADTIEEKVMSLQRRKAILFDALFNGEAADPDQFGQLLTPDDIRELLS